MLNVYDNLKFLRKIRLFVCFFAVLVSFSASSQEKLPVSLDDIVTPSAQLRNIPRNDFHRVKMDNPRETIKSFLRLRKTLEAAISTSLCFNKIA